MNTLEIIATIAGLAFCIGLISFSIYVIIDILRVWMDDDLSEIEIEDEEDDNDLGIFMQ